MSVYDDKSAEDIIQYMYSHGMTQEGVNRVYEMRNLGAPPQLPANMVGAKRQATKGGAYFYQNGKRVLDSGTSAFTHQFNSQAIDPFRSYNVGNWLGVAGLVAGTAGAGAAIGGGSAAAGAGGASAGGAGGVGAGAANGLASGFANGLGAATGAAAGSATGAAVGTGAGALGGGLGVFANGGAGGLAGVGGGNAGALAASGGITGGAGTGGTIQGALGGLSGVANSVSGVGGGSMPGGTASWMDWIGPALSAGSSIYGTNQANNASSAAAKEAVGEQRRQFDLVRSDTAPTRALGEAAIDRLSRLYGYGSPGATAGGYSNGGGQIGSSGIGINPLTGAVTQGITGVRSPSSSGSGQPDMGAFFESPDYQYNLAETLKGTERSAAARGGLLSGGAGLALQRNASGLASREYGSFVDRLMQQAGLGNTGIGASAAAGANSANNISAIQQNLGNARSSAYMNNAANVNNSIQTGISNYMLSRYLGN